VTSILTMLADHGIQATKAAGTKGGEWHSACPGCGGRDRFHVWPEQNEGAGSWWCRGCEKGGDAIQFVIEFDGLTYKQACDKLGLEAKDPKTRPSSYLRAPKLAPAPPAAQPASSATAAIPGDQPAQWLAKAADFSTWCAQKLKESAVQTKWHETRGIDLATARRFGLGFNKGERNGKDIFRPRTSWGLADNGKKLWLPVGLVIPLRDTAGAVTRLRIRRMEGDPRYYVVPGSAMDCLTVDCAGARAIVVVESELDAITIACQAPGLCGVVALGNNSRKPDPVTMAHLAAAAVILVALDVDAGGDTGTKWWTRNFATAKDWPVPEGKDPGEAFGAGVNLADWIRAGLPEAWNLSTKRSRDDQTAKAMEQNQPAVLAAVDAPALSPVRRLADLVAASPVVVINEGAIRRVSCPPLWADANRQRLNDITSLVMFDRQVNDMIRRCDLAVIDAEAVALAAKLMG